MPPPRAGHIRVAVEWLGEPGQVWVIVPDRCTIGDIKNAALHTRGRAEEYALQRQRLCLWVRVGDSLRQDSESAAACGVTDGSPVSVLSSVRTDLFPSGDAGER